jgi:hypothetical protein
MLVPREHGAYGQLLFPLVCALLIGRPAAGAYLLAAAGLAGFLAHEALLVLLGQRGSRALRERRRQAWSSLTLFGGIACVCGASALVVLPRLPLLALGATVALALLVAGAVAVGRERSTVGEMLVAVTLASLSVPVALAGGLGMTAALTVFAVFASVFVTATAAVRAMIGRTSRAGGPPPVMAGLLPVCVVVLLEVLAVRGHLARVAPWAALPVSGLGLWLTIRAPSPRNLRAVGWTLVGASALTAVILVIALVSVTAAH